MATNVFFDQAVKTEQNLVEDLVVESLRMYGHNVFYLPRNIVSEDQLLGEAPVSSFEDAYEVEMYLEGVEGFEGEGDLYSKFGVEVRDQATFVLSRRSWERFVSLDTNLATDLRPNEGDLIYFPLSKSLFEIKFVEHENPFYQLGKLYVFKMQCELFEYSGEKFDTSVADLDEGIELAQGQAVELTLQNLTAARDFVVGETISQMVAPNVVVSGIVSAWSESSNKLTVSSITSTNADFTSFLATDTTEGYILTEEDAPAGVQADRIVTQDGDFIDFENGTASRTIPSFITDGSTGTSNIAYEAGTVADSILLEDGTDTDRDQEFDHIVLETSLSSDRSITSVGSDQTLPTDAGAFNLEFETDADGIIDFSESNPFGEAT